MTLIPRFGSVKYHEALFNSLSTSRICRCVSKVAVSEATIETMRKRKEAGQSLWRISSTCFGHVASDQVRMDYTCMFY